MGVLLSGDCTLHVAMSSNNYSFEYYSCSHSLFFSQILYTFPEADPTNFLVALASYLFPDSPVGLQDITDILRKCEALAATSFTIKEAVTWGADFRMPLAVHTRDVDDLRLLDSNLEGLIRLRQPQFEFSRLSVDSVPLIGSKNRLAALDDDK